MRSLLQYFNFSILLIFIALMLFIPLVGALFAMIMGGIQVVSSLLLSVDSKCKKEVRLAHLAHGLVSILFVSIPYFRVNWDILIYGSIILGLFFITLIALPEKYAFNIAS